MVAEEMVVVAEPDEAMMAGEKALERAAVAARGDALLLGRSSSPSKLSTPPPSDESVLVGATVVVDRTTALAPAGVVGATGAEFVDDPAPPNPKRSSKPPPELDADVCAAV